MNSNIKRALLASVATISGGAFMPSIAQAQDATNTDQTAAAKPADADTTTASNDTADKSQIVVTATRRTVKLQDVPMSVSAKTGKQLDEIGARDAQDYINSIPGVSFVDNGAGRDTFTIRGIPPLGSGSTTGIYLDETPLPIDLRLFDVDRVEVLRGPQGTLYGVSTMGGAIRTITRKPNSTRTELRFQGSLDSVSHGGMGGDANVALNVPIVEGQLATRVIFYKEREAGYIDNYTVDRQQGAPGQSPDTPATAISLIAKDRGAHDIEGARVAIRYDPSDLINVTATYLWQNDKWNGIGSEDEDLGPGKLRQGRLFDEIFSSNNQLWNLTGELHLPFATLMSSTSYSTNHIVTNVDASYAFDIFGLKPVKVSEDYNGNAFVQELRLTSKDKGRLNWVLGAFYSKARLTGHQDLVVTGANDLLGGIAPGDVLQTFLPHQGGDEIAAYGEATFQFTKELGLTGGARHYRVRSSFDDVLETFGVPAPDKGKASETGNTWKLGLHYQPSANLLFYANASSGYRPGGTNQSVQPGGVPAIPKQFNSDKLWDYEIGWRVSGLGQRVVFNGALYYVDWTDIQIVLGDSNGNSGTFNAGKARSEGVELELDLRPLPGLNVTSAFSYTDTKLKTRFQSYRPGDRIPNIPKFSANVNARYTHGLSALWEGYLQGTLTYVGNRDYYQQDLLDPDPDARTHVVVPAYTKVDARVGVSNGQYELALFAKNLFDKRGQIGRDSLYGYWRTQYIQPRTIGVSLKADF